MKNILLSVAPAAMVALLASPALASLTVAADIDGGLAVGYAATWNSATFGMTARAVYEVDLGEGFFLGPEAGFGFMFIGDTDVIADGSSLLPPKPALFRLLGGLRLGFRAGDDGRLIPSMFVRGGHAWISSRAGIMRHAMAPLMDAGLAVDYAVSPLLRIGGHAGCEALWTHDQYNPFTAIHAGVAFTFTPGEDQRPVAGQGVGR
ncbi:hypothetical protein WMF18_38905 [Sorangium sp. So ce315]|uniref:hypothetical protein n=1 Tax=Sorangium sp. So ce315 TaxID=3133299 RepID=UPI003F622474